MTPLWPRALVLVLLLLPVCHAFDWGDFHKISVVIGTILGFGLGFGAIVLVAYMACMRPFFDSFQEEVAMTHRTWHPWPIGSVRWQLQKLMRTGRTEELPTQFPTSGYASSVKVPPPSAAPSTQYLSVPGLQSALVQPAPYTYAPSASVFGTEVPIIRSTETGYSCGDRFPQPRSTASYLLPERIERPTYFTPSPEKSIFEELTITREESFLSRGSLRRPTTTTANDDNTLRGPASSATAAATVLAGDAQIVRTTTTRHSQRSLKADGSTFI